MNIVIAGGSGFIGQALVSDLAARGRVLVLTRDTSRVSEGEPLQWNPPDDGPWQQEVAAADVVINLSGASIAEGRWTRSRKATLLASRTEPIAALNAAFRRSPDRSRVFISAAGVGIYEDAGDESIDETGSTGSTFMSDLGRAWEAAALEAEPYRRVVVPRIGVVIGAGGGIVGKLAPQFRLGLGGSLGSGKQWWPWISLHDLVRVVLWFIDTRSASGIYNAVAPHPVRNREFTSELASLVHRPAFFRAPAIALRTALGDMADEALLASQRVVPRRLLSEGFEFHHQQIREALAHALR